MAKKTPPPKKKTPQKTPGLRKATSEQTRRDMLARCRKKAKELAKGEGPTTREAIFYYLCIRESGNLEMHEAVYRTLRLFAGLAGPSPSKKD